MTEILRYFEYSHLPAHLHVISKPFSDLAHKMEDLLPSGPEKSTGLRKLLEAKDCMVRASLDVTPAELFASEYVQSPQVCQACKIGAHYRCENCVCGDNLHGETDD